MSGINGIGGNQQALLSIMPQLNQEPLLHPKIPAEGATSKAANPNQQFEQNLFVEAGNTEVGKANAVLHKEGVAAAPAGLHRSMDIPPSQDVAGVGQSASAASLQSSARSVERPWDQLLPPKEPENKPPNS